MDWLWPDLLLLLGLIPLIVAIYIWVLRRRSRFVVRYSSLSLVQQALLQPSFLRRHLPFILLLGALTSLVIASARPITPEAVLSGRTTIILSLDISRSMCMQDIKPNRLEVAKAAARSFVQVPVPGTQIGVVAFSGFAELAQAPTTDSNLLEHTITNLTTATQTAIGSAILRSLDAIAEVDQRVAKSQETDRLLVPASDSWSQALSPEDEFVPHIIVLLSDGASNTGPSPISAAQQAAERGVRIYSIGFGTTKNAVMDCWNIPKDDLSGSPGLASQVGGGGPGNAPDLTTLRQIAEITGGEFFSAASAAELQMVFQKLHNYIAQANQTIEISVHFAAIGAILAIMALILSFLWHPML